MRKCKKNHTEETLQGASLPCYLITASHVTPAGRCMFAPSPRPQHLTPGGPSSSGRWQTTALRRQAHTTGWRALLTPVLYSPRPTEPQLPSRPFLTRTFLDMNCTQTLTTRPPSQGQDLCQMYPAPLWGPPSLLIPKPPHSLHCVSPWHFPFRSQTHAWPAWDMDLPPRGRGPQGKGLWSRL